MKKKWTSIFGIMVMVFGLLLVGCSADRTNGAQGAQATSLADTGTLVLKVNPEIAIEYDENGKVTAITGKNEHGSEIVNQYPDYIGKDSRVVVKELIALIGDAGYFVEEVEGEAKKIVIELEAGSALPGDHFLEEMAASAQYAVEEYKLNSDVEVEGDTYISLEEAKQIAFKHAGVDGSKARFDDQEFDIDDGVPSYELEFEVEGNEYEYDIHAVSSEILESEIDEENKANKEVKAKPEKKAEKETKAKAEKPAYMSIDEAKQIAFKHAGVDGSKARFDDQEFDIDDGVPSYELEFEIEGNEYEYDIHAVSGDVLESKIDKENKANKEVKETPKKKAEKETKTKAEKPVYISIDEAKQVAFKHAGIDGSNARFDDIERDNDDGVATYELEFEIDGTEYEFEIDAVSGKVLDYEKDND